MSIRAAGRSSTRSCAPRSSPRLRILPFIAPAIAKGIAARRAAGVGEPLNVIACENGIRATSQLREEVYKHLSAEEAAWCDAHVGFADCSVDRIVPPVRSENPIDVVVENFYEWNVEEKSFVGGAPHIKGMNLADNLSSASSLRSIRDMPLRPIWDG